MLHPCQVSGRCSRQPRECQRAHQLRQCDTSSVLIIPPVVALGINTSRNHMPAPQLHSPSGRQSGNDLMYPRRRSHHGSHPPDRPDATCHLAASKQSAVVYIHHGLLARPPSARFGFLIVLSHGHQPRLARHRRPVPHAHLVP